MRLLKPSAHGVGNAVVKVSERISKVFFEHFGHFDDRLELTACCPAVSQSNSSKPAALLTLPQACRTSIATASNISVKRECFPDQGTVVVFTPHVLHLDRGVCARRAVSNCIVSNCLPRSRSHDCGELGCVAFFGTVKLRKRCTATISSDGAEPSRSNQ